MKKISIIFSFALGGFTLLSCNYDSQKTTTDQEEISSVLELSLNDDSAGLGLGKEGEDRLLLEVENSKPDTFPDSDFVVREKEKMGTGIEDEEMKINNGVYVFTWKGEYEDGILFERLDFEIKGNKISGQGSGAASSDGLTWSCDFEGSFSSFKACEMKMKYYAENEEEDPEIGKETWTFMTAVSLETVDEESRKKTFQLKPD